MVIELSVCLHIMLLLTDVLLIWWEDNLHVFPFDGVRGQRSRRPILDFYTFSKTDFILTDIFHF
jgi:hypothetical protein